MGVDKLKTLLALSLDELCSAGAPTLAPEPLADLLVSIGNALRLSLHLSPKFRNLACELADRQLIEVVQAELADRIASLANVAITRPEEVLRARDRGESLLHGLLWVAITSRRSPENLGSLSILQAALESCDSTLAKRVNRQQAEACLADQPCIEEIPSWLDVLPEEESETAEGHELPLDLGHAILPREWGPPDFVVANYVSEGTGATWVEKFASRSPEFCEELLDTIDDCRKANLPVALMPRIWRARKQTAPRNADLVVELPLLRHAAASEKGIPDVPARLNLGRLPLSNAEAVLVPRDGALELQIAAPKGSLKTIEFGESRIECGSNERIWTALCSVHAKKPQVTLRIEDSSGAVFSVEICPVPESSS